MSYNDEPKEIGQLPNPKWSRQKMEMRSHKALFPWWVWPLAILVAIAAFLIVWFGFVAPSLRGAPAATPTPTPTVQPTQPAPTGLPPIPPTGVVTPQVTPAVVSTRTPAPIPTPSGSIAVGSKVKVAGAGADKLRLRSGPGVNYTTIALVEDGREFEVLEGPQAANNYQWWRVKDSQGTIGWAAANWLQPIP